MLTRRIACLIAFLFIFYKPFAQVNLQTGSATFSLPLFTWQDDKSRLASSVALGYNSGNGLKANDVASNVGQGWSLVAGGVITRIQVGEPDDQMPYYDNSTGQERDDDLTKYPAGYWYAPVPAINGCPQALTKYPIYKSQNTVYAQHNKTIADKQLDYFAFQFNGKAGMFILDTVGGDHGVPLDQTKMKITFTRDPSMADGTNNGTRTSITSFTIQDVDGLIYLFKVHGLTEVLTENYCDANLIQQQTQPGFAATGIYHQAGFVNPKSVNPWIIGSWYLSEIDDPLTLRKIIFNYTPPKTLNNFAGANISYNLWHDFFLISHKISVTKTPDIASVVFPDGHTVTFNYASSSRMDLIGELALSSVDITYQTITQPLRYLAEYQLNTSYFILNGYGTPVTPYEKIVARLALMSVKKIGIDFKEDTPPYIFDYYLGSNAVEDYVPPPFFWAKDVWGYYNGNNSTDYNTNIAIPLNKTLSTLKYSEIKSLCFLKSGTTTINLNAKSGYAQNGLLKQIVYPTGGSLTYQYAQNSGVFEDDPTQTIVTVGGVHVSQTSSSDGGYSNGCANPIVTQYNYVMNGVGSASSLWGLETPVNSIKTGSSYAPEFKGYHFTWKCLPWGCCYYHFFYPGILSMNESISITGLQQALESIAPALGILSTVTDIMDIVTVACGSTGFFAWAAVVVDIIGGIIQVGVSCLTDYSKAGSSAVYYNFNLNDASPLPTQFKRVEVVENPGTIGKTVHQFSSSVEYAVWIPAGTNPDIVAKQRFAPWAYGLPTFTTVYDASGNKIKETQNVYDYSGAQFLIDGCPKCGPNISGLYTPLGSCKCGVQYTFSQRNVDWSNPAFWDPPPPYQLVTDLPNANMTVDFYGMYSGLTNLKTSYERVYRVGDQTQYVETVTNFSYNSYFNFEVNQINTTQSNGDVTKKYFTYSSDYPNTQNPTLISLVHNNIVTLPVSNGTTFYSTISHSEKVLSEKVTEYGQLAKGNIKPSRVLEQRFAQPSSTATFYSPDNTNNSSIYKVTQSFTYDANENLIGLKDEGLRTISNIYDYDDKYITATVINADPVVDHPAFSSFETPDFTRSGWTLTGAVSLNNSSSITGTSSFALTSSKSFSATLNTAKPYILSFWATAGLTVNGGASLIKSAPVINGYTYYEYAISQGTSSVSVSGNANIDELRLYPKTARMRTTTYDPLIGKTSECDENNRITYYQYDNLGRLQFAKDENGNIVKMYEYNNVSAIKQNGCPGNYSSHQLIEIFTKACSAGYLGSDVPFTLPAGKYTSLISQADADAQAQTDALTNGQTNANTIGTCSLIYYNAPQSETDSSQSCDPGKKGGWVTYTVPYGRYSSIISQADANQKAAIDIAANALAYANAPATRICLASTDPDWEADDNSQMRCQKDVNGNYTGNQEALATDLNPNSSTYNHQQWMTLRQNESVCPHTPGNPPNLSSSTFSTVSTSGVITGTPGAIKSITVTLNSSTTDASLTGSVGFNVNLNGSGTHTVTNNVTIPANGYISWNLTISGTRGTSGYVSSNITVN